MLSFSFEKSLGKKADTQAHQVARYYKIELLDWTRFCRWQCMLVDLNDGTLCMILRVCNFYMNL